MADKLKSAVGIDIDGVRILAYITGTVDQETPLHNEYLVAENRVLKAQLKTRLRLIEEKRITLAEISHRLGYKAVLRKYSLAAQLRCF